MAPRERLALLRTAFSVETGLQLHVAFASRSSARRTLMKYAREGTTVRLLPGEDARQTPSNCLHANALGGDQLRNSSRTTS